MKISGNTILVTGGSSGIGLALAMRFLKAGNQLIITGRNINKLKQVKEQLPEIHIIQSDISDSAERIKLCEAVTSQFPGVNVLVNNAGIQNRNNFTEDISDWSRHHEEIAINLEGPIHLSKLFIPHLKPKPDSAIINVTSGLAFVPAAFAPVYSATKAALHSFSMSLRFLLQKSGIKVIEIVPPAVQTDLGGPGLHTFGVPLNEFADAVFEKLKTGDAEIGYGTSETARNASREELDRLYLGINNRS